MLVRRSRRRPRRSGVLVVALLLALAGCTSDDEPTVSQAGETLKNHVLQLLKERNAQDIEITDPGGTDIACDGGKARRTFAATGMDLETGTAPDALNDMMLGALKRVGSYTIVRSGGEAASVSVADRDARTVLFLESRTNGQYVVRGQTECLRTS
jgi:hypothetical protein